MPHGDLPGRACGGQPAGHRRPYLRQQTRPCFRLRKDALAPGLRPGIASALLRRAAAPPLIAAIPGADT